MPAIVRPATPDDLPSLGALWSRFNAYLDGLDTPQNIDPALFGRFEALCFGDRAVCNALLALNGAEPVGYLVYYWGVRMEQVNAALYVADVFVSGEARGSGAGRALMDAAREIALERGCESVLWQVWDRNEAAIAFYRSIGAERLEGEVPMIWDI